jgi:hypothetical protein
VKGKSSLRYWGDEIQKNEVNGTYVTHAEMRNTYKILSINLKGENLCGMLFVDARIMLKYIL